MISPNRFFHAFVVLFLVAGSACAQTTDPVDDGPAPVWLSFNEALDVATQSGKKVLIDVWSPRCGWCARMQKEVYTDQALLDYVNENFVTGRLNIDVQTDTVSYREYTLSSAELSQGLGASGTPTSVFLDEGGEYITRLPGYHGLDDFMQVLKFIGDDVFRDMSFQEYVDAQAAGSN